MNLDGDQVAESPGGEIPQRPAQRRLAPVACIGEENQPEHGAYREEGHQEQSTELHHRVHTSAVPALDITMLH